MSQPAPPQPPLPTASSSSSSAVPQQPNHPSNPAPDQEAVSNGLKRKVDDAQLDAPSPKTPEENRKWLAGQVELMERAFKDACFTKAIIMRFHADVREQNVQHLQPRAPRHLAERFRRAQSEFVKARKIIVSYVAEAEKQHTLYLARRKAELQAQAVAQAEAEAAQAAAEAEATSAAGTGSGEAATGATDAMAVDVDALEPPKATLEGNGQAQPAEPPLPKQPTPVVSLEPVNGGAPPQESSAPDAPAPAQPDAAADPDAGMDFMEYLNATTTAATTPGGGADGLGLGMSMGDGMALAPTPGGALDQAMAAAAAEVAGQEQSGFAGSSAVGVQEVPGSSSQQHQTMDFAAALNGQQGMGLGVPMQMGGPMDQPLDQMEIENMSSEDIMRALDGWGSMGTGDASGVGGVGGIGSGEAIQGGSGDGMPGQEPALPDTSQGLPPQSTTGTGAGTEDQTQDLFNLLAAFPEASTGSDTANNNAPNSAAMDGSQGLGLGIDMTMDGLNGGSVQPDPSAQPGQLQADGTTMPLDLQLPGDLAAAGMNMGGGAGDLAANFDISQFTDLLGEFPELAEGGEQLGEAGGEMNFDAFEKMMDSNAGGQGGVGVNAGGDGVGGSGGATDGDAGADAISAEELMNLIASMDPGTA